jgi:hypothetical protein
MKVTVIGTVAVANTPCPSGYWYPAGVLKNMATKSPQLTYDPATETLWFEAEIEIGDLPNFRLPVVDFEIDLQNGEVRDNASENTR